VNRSTEGKRDFRAPIFRTAMKLTIIPDASQLTNIFSAVGCH
jgi:hypothetical protein